MAIEKAINSERPNREPGAQEPRIKISKDGPYLVFGRVPLLQQAIAVDAGGDPCAWHTEGEYPARVTYTLCRCGQSKNKPYCDGTHLRIEFDGTETASRESYLDQAEQIEGPTLKLGDAHALCAHARFCDRAGGTWSLVRESDDPEARRIAIEEVGDCPSGRLVVWDEEGKPIEPQFEQSIVLVEDPQLGVSGPIWVRGGIPIESADGFVYEIRNRVTLCRCGRSANKPFCDSSHVIKDD